MYEFTGKKFNTCYVSGTGTCSGNTAVSKGWAVLALMEFAFLMEKVDNRQTLN